MAKDWLKLRFPVCLRLEFMFGFCAPPKNKKRVATPKAAAPKPKAAPKPAGSPAEAAKTKEPESQVWALNK